MYEDFLKELNELIASSQTFNGERRQVRLRFVMVVRRLRELKEATIAKEKSLKDVSEALLESLMERIQAPFVELLAYLQSDNDTLMLKFGAVMRAIEGVTKYMNTNI